MAGRNGGRPPKYTPDRVEKIVSAIRVGATQRLAAQYAGITEDTLSQWKHDKPEFAEKIREAEGASAIKWNALIEQAARRDWRAAAWKLERRFPADYGKALVEQQHTGDVTITIKYADDDGSDSTQ